jgi:phosphoribosylformylglycinamidine synthase PurS subunit
MKFSVVVDVQLRSGISDPQGQTIERALPALGYEGVTDVRVGKSIRFEVDATDSARAESEVSDMCERFLSNPVIEDVTVTVSAQ